MRSHRFYTTSPLNERATVTLDKVQSSHITKVLRLGIGQEIILFNGDGFDYSGRITATGKATQVLIEQKHLNPATPKLKIHLAQAMARGDRMDYAIQKAVEMGVSEITPLHTEYVQFRLDHKRLTKKLAHWEGIITSALAQSGRADQVTLNPPVAFESWINDYSTCIYLHPRTSNEMSDALNLAAVQGANEIQIAIGPEGGFSDAEMAMIPEQHIIGLGPRILRTETAATAVLAILQHALSSN